MSYVSDELSHFVGGMAPRPDNERYELLVERILKTGQLLHPPFIPGISGNLQVNPNAKMSTGEMYAPEVVCFCDIPVEDLGIHAGKYGRFGLSFPKAFLVAKGANPVLYVVNDSAGMLAGSLREAAERLQAQGIDDQILKQYVVGHETRAEAFDEMLTEYHDLFGMFRKLLMDARQTPGVPPDVNRLMRLQHFLDFYLLSFVKAFDASRSEEDPGNYYMEREWRVVGNALFDLEDMSRVFLPAEYRERFDRDLPQYQGAITHLS
jgi:hypothetical protein